MHASAVYLKPLERLAIFDADPFPRLRVQGRMTVNGQCVALHPGSGSEKKNWPEANWAELIDNLVARTALTILLVGGEAEAFDVAQARLDVAAAARRLLAAHPEVAAIVLECTNLPPYAAAVRAATGVPVYDIVSMVCWLHAGLAPRPFSPPAGQ